MKKGIVFALIVILVGGMLVLFGAVPKKSQAATIEMDQLNYPPYYTNPPGYKYYTVKNADVYVPCQKFKPAKSVMATYLDLPLGYGFGEEASLLIHQAIGSYSNEVGDSIATYTANVSTEFEISQWQRFNAPGETTVNTSNYYWMCLGTNNINLRWYYSDPSGYDNGFLLLKYRNEPLVYQANQDFGFRTFGYDPDTPTSPSGDQPGNQGTGTTGTAGTAGAGEALGATTTSIVKPTNLTATYSDTAGARGIKLTWKASTTTDIDGYKIFRSEKSTTGYTKLAETKKDKVEYLDQDVVAGKTYYYQVRAYKSSQQSVSSNTASAAVSADAPPAKPTNLTVVATTTSTLSLKWKANTETNIVSYNLAIYKGEEKVKTADVKNDQTTFEFDGLAENTVYKITLTATNDKGKISDPDSTSGATAAAETKYSWFNALTVSGVLLILVLTGLLIYKLRKRQKENKA